MSKYYLIVEVDEFGEVAGLVAMNDSETPTYYLSREDAEKELLHYLEHTPYSETAFFVAETVLRAEFKRSDFESRVFCLNEILAT